MAASVGSLISGSTLVGGVGFLPDRRGCPCSSLASVSGTVPQFGVKKVGHLKHSSTSCGNRSTNSVSRHAIVAQQGEGSDKENSKVFQSMKDASESRKEEMYGALDAVDIAKIISEAERLSPRTKNKSPIQPPRFATLRAFGEAGGEGVVTGFGGTSVFELLAASVEASKQVRNWEILSGRLAMLALSIAIGVEFFTGESVFQGIDLGALEGTAALCAVATLSAATFAFAWRTKADVVSLMSRNYKNMVDSALDNLIDGLFFDESK